MHHGWQTRTYKQKSFISSELLQKAAAAAQSRTTDSRVADSFDMTQKTDSGIARKPKIHQSEAQTEQHIHSQPFIQSMGWLCRHWTLRVISTTFYRHCCCKHDMETDQSRTAHEHRWMVLWRQPSQHLQTDHTAWAQELLVIGCHWFMDGCSLMLPFLRGLRRI